MKPRYKKKSKRTGKYKSVLESKVARMLGRKAKYESESIAYVLPKRYTPDFILVRPRGDSSTTEHKIYVEVKGWLRVEDQQKMKSVKHCNPALDIRFYFPNNGRVQGSRMTNSQWCEKYDFKYTIGRIPKEWLT